MSIATERIGSLSARLQRKAITAILASGLVAVVIFLQIRWSPRFNEMNADSGLFAYGGQQILRGQLLYHDVFDTKPPAVFYIDALAFALWGQTVWSLWLMGILWVSVTGLGLFFVLRTLADERIAFVAVLLFLFVLHNEDYYQGGNFTEIYAMLPQVLLLACAVWYFLTRRRVGVFLTGLSCGLAILCKPTYAGLGIAALVMFVGTCLIQRQWRAMVTIGLWFLLGTLLPLAGVAAYWGARGGLADLWNAVVTFDVAYVRGGFSIKTLYVTFRNLAEGFPMLGLTLLSSSAVALYAWGLSSVVRRLKASRSGFDVAQSVADTPRGPTSRQLAFGQTYASGRRNIGSSVT